MQQLISWYTQPLQMKRYKHLTISERETLGQLLVRGWSLTDIAKAMGRHKSTISREISNSKLSRYGYRALIAQALVEPRIHTARRGKKIENNLQLQEYIQTHLKLGWSPEQIANRLKMEYPNEPDMQISHADIS